MWIFRGVCTNRNFVIDYLKWKTVGMGRVHVKHGHAVYYHGVVKRKSRKTPRNRAKKLKYF